VVAVSIRHAEKVSRVGESRSVETGSFYTLEVDYVTMGGVRKTLVLPHCVAESLRAALADEFETMPEERRKRSFFASFKRNRS
jgi:hypothetical protein